MRNSVNREQLPALNTPSMETPRRKRSKSTVDQALGELVRSLRIRSGFTRKQLGPYLNIHQNSVTRLENGASSLTVDAFIRLCEACDANPIELLQPIAPQLWGGNSQTASTLTAIIEHLVHMDSSTLDIVRNLLRHLRPETIDSRDDQSEPSAVEKSRDRVAVIE